jgi:hypothetical protein
LSVAELIVAYWKFAQGYYAGPNGGEVACVKQAMKILREGYGRTTVADFGPLSLKALRLRMIERGWSRSYVNSQTGRIRRMFRWGVENEMVPASVYHALTAVMGVPAVQHAVIREVGQWRRSAGPPAAEHSELR